MVFASHAAISGVMRGGARIIFTGKNTLNFGVTAGF